MVTLLVFLIILSILIFIHELGHFATAKKFGVRVEEFGFGIPPRIWGKKIGETIYSLNLLPFGGFVRVSGEDPASSDALDTHSFANKHWSKRLTILLAGVFMNIFLAVFIYYVFLFSNGFRTSTLPLISDYDFKFGRVERLDTVIFGFEQGSAAEQAGIKNGEAILSINAIPVTDVTDVRRTVRNKAGSEVRVTLLDVTKSKPSVREVIVVPTSDSEGNGFLGVALSSAVNIYYGDSLPSIVTSGFQHSFNVLGYSSSTFSQLVSASISEQTLEPVSAGVAGPVGIYSIVGAILDYSGRDAVLSLLDFMAVLSLSLAFINILPIPALDGGRAMFVVFEAVTRKKVSPKLESNVHKWGMLGLITLAILITMKDVVNLF